MPLFRQLENFENPDGPRFAADYKTEQPEYDGTLRIVSYNIDRGKEYRLGLQDLQEFKQLQNADIVFLQEMEERGTDYIAAGLGYEYVYYPASIMQGKNFGNAILSRWKVSHSKKIILPNKSRFNGQIRIAVRANVAVNGRDILVYCAHTEIYTASIRHRKEQVEGIVEDVPLSARHVIVGGDFNTVSIRSIRRLSRQFAELGMVRASKGAGATVKKYAIDPAAADHIFTWGFEVLDKGKVEDGRASDHYPIWVTLKFKQ